MREVKASMNCRLFEEILADLDRPEAMAAALREAALAHAETCPECGLLLTESESLEMHLRTLAAAANSEPAPTRIEAAVLKEFREHHESERRGKRRRQAAVLGAAAAVALAVGLLVGEHGLHRQGAGNEQSAKSMEKRAPSEAPGEATVPAVMEASAAAATPHEASIAKGKANRAERRMKAPATSPATEEAAFVRLPYSDSSAEIEGGEVVRVILSPAALESLGMQPGTFAPAENVSADLLLDEDGTPEAIRMVAQADNGSISN